MGLNKQKGFKNLDLRDLFIEDEVVQKQRAKSIERLERAFFETGTREKTKTDKHNIEIIDLGRY